MRVIAGSRRHLLLKTIPGIQIRPTTDRTKETLFNILNPYLPECSFLDLFSGSGAIGIEALSRGAMEVIMVEQNKEALECIQDNLETVKLVQEARVMGMDVLTAISRLEAEKKCFDIIFMDPPYDQEWEKRVLERLKTSELISEDTWIVVEASLETEFEYLDSYGFELFREKRYKNNKHVFIQLKQQEPA